MADTSLNKDNVSVYVVVAGTNGSSAIMPSSKITGEIVSFSISGAEPQRESQAVLGGYVRKKTGRSDVEVSMDIIVNSLYASSITRWESYFLGSTGLSTGQPTELAFFAHSTKNSNHKTVAINNCEITSLEVTQAADDSQMVSLTLSAPAETELGSPNLKASNLIYSASFFNW